MKKWRVLLLSVLMLAAMSTVAWADATPSDSRTVQIQLDGNILSLQGDKEAIYNAEQGRVYLPFRSLFETLGAEVSYDESNGFISATKDGREVLLFNGQTVMVVKENGVTTQKNMGVAPYIENGRTMIPVRFAGEALDFGVGWDQLNQTVVMIDTEKLVQQYGDKFKIVEKVLAFAPMQDRNLHQYGDMDVFVYDVDGTFIELAFAFDGDFAPDGSANMQMILQDSNAMENELFNSASNPIAERNYTRVYLLENFSENDRIFQFIYNRTEDDLYFGSYLLSELFGVTDDESMTWLSFSNITENYLSNDMIPFTDEENVTAGTLISVLLKQATIANVNDYRTIVGVLDQIVAEIGDQQFVRTADGYTLSSKYVDADIRMNGNGAITEYTLSGDVLLPDAAGMLQYSLNMDDEGCEMAFKCSADGELIGGNYNFNWEAGKAPDLTIPKGKNGVQPTVLSVEMLLQSLGLSF